MRTAGTGILEKPSGTLVCPYCREPFHLQSIRVCAGCGTLHHTNCWNEYGRCSVFGCQGKPRIQTRNYWMFAPSVIVILSILNPFLALSLSPLLFPALIYSFFSLFYFPTLLVLKGVVLETLSDRQLRGYIFQWLMNGVTLILVAHFLFFK